MTSGSEILTTGLDNFPGPPLGALRVHAAPDGSAARVRVALEALQAPAVGPVKGWNFGTWSQLVTAGTQVVTKTNS